MVSRYKVSEAGLAYVNCSTTPRWQGTTEERFSDQECIHMVRDGRKGGAPDGF